MSKLLSGITSPEYIKNRNVKSILYFIIILAVSHFFWKFFVKGDEGGELVTFFGMNISQPFIFMSHHIAELSNKILNFLGYDTLLQPENIIRHSESKNAIRVIWGCTGIKQAYILLCIIALYKGKWLHKLWYIPLGWLCVYLFNIFRIVFITAIVDKHPLSFDFWHEYVLKYLFYIMIFGLWIVWEEKFCSKYQSPNAE